MIKYALYEGAIETVPEKVRYKHYENGRCLIYTPRKPNKSGWRKVSGAEIKNSLSQHERQWFDACRAEINAQYLRKPSVQRDMQEYVSGVLDRFEDNLRKTSEEERQRAKDADKADEVAETSDEQGG